MVEIKPLVGADWLVENLDEVQLFDCRNYLDERSEIEAFERGHLPGAVFVDLDADLAAPPSQPGGRHPFPTPELFAAAMGRLGYDGDRPAVVYDDVGGGMAARLWFMLSLLELPVALLDGGLPAWPGELETGPSRPVPAEFAVRPWPTDRLVDADEVARRIDAGGVVIDARSSSRYRGEANPIDPRFGHIPGAINRAWDENLGADGRMLDLPTLGERYAEAIGQPEGAPRTVAYCGSGVTACHDLLALSLLDADADLYVGSWSEWGADPERPVETG